MPDLVLRIEEHDRPSREVLVRPGLTIGRLPENACVLEDPKVSGRHARIIRLEDGRFAVEDLGSANRTQVEGGAELGKGDHAVLEPGTRFQVGLTWIGVAAAAGGVEPTRMMGVVDLEAAKAEAAEGAGPGTAEPVTGKAEKEKRAEKAEKAAPPQARKEPEKARTPASTKEAEPPPHDVDSTEAPTPSRAMPAVDVEESDDDPFGQKTVAEPIPAVDPGESGLGIKVDAGTTMQEVDLDPEDWDRVGPTDVTAKSPLARKAMGDGPPVATTDSDVAKPSGDKGGKPAAAEEPASTAKSKRVEEPSGAAGPKKTAKRDGPGKTKKADEAGKPAAPDKAGKSAAPVKAAPKKDAPAKDTSADEATVVSSNSNVSPGGAPDEPTLVAGKAPAAPREDATQALRVSSPASRAAALTDAELIREMKPRLVFDEEKERRAVVIDKETFTIGRKRSSAPTTVDCSIDHPTVSTTHAAIRFTTRHFFLEDAGSKNGTFVGGKSLAVMASRELKPDVAVRFGVVDALFVVDRDVEERPLDRTRHGIAVRLLGQRRVITRKERDEALRAAAAGEHPGQHLILRGSVSVRQWTEAMAAAEQASLGAGRAGELWKILMAVAALILVGVAFFFALKLLG